MDQNVYVFQIARKKKKKLLKKFNIFISGKESNKMKK